MEDAEEEETKTSDCSRCSRDHPNVIVRVAQFLLKSMIPIFAFLYIVGIRIHIFNNFE